MTRSPSITGVEFGLPLIEEFEGCSGIADFVAEIVRNAAVSVNVEEMLAQVAWQEPRGDREVFVVGAG
jgi:hypothetical protein